MREALGTAVVRDHVVVRAAWMARTIGGLMYLALVGSWYTGVPGGVPAWEWALVLAGGLIWPHLAFLTDRRGRGEDAVAGVGRSILVDHLIIGLLAPRVAFSPWVLTAFMVVQGSAAAQLGGLGLVGRGALLSVVAAAAVTLAGGARSGLATPQGTVLVSVAVIVAYTLFTNVFGHHLSRRVRVERREVLRVNAQLEAVSRKLAKFLAPQVYESIFSGNVGEEAASKRRFLTVFFSDIRGFTPMVEHSDPERLTRQLNEYLTSMSAIAIAHGGTVDKYIGDAMMVFFGDPGTEGPEEDARRAVRMALEMQRRLAHLRQRWARDGGEAFHVRIGIHSGPCTVGSFGSEDRLDYTVMGHVVNVASRLEGASPPDGVLVSGATRALVGDEFACVPRGEVELKGIAKPVAAFLVQHADEAE